MADLPADVLTGIVHVDLSVIGHVGPADLDLENEPPVGTVVFIPTVAQLLHEPTGKVFGHLPSEVLFDGTSSVVSIELLATDNVSLLPSGWTYEVRFMFEGDLEFERLHIAVPSGSESTLGDFIVPSEPPPSDWSLVRLNDLGDVDAFDPTLGHVLTFSGTGWIAAAPGATTEINVDQIADSTLVGRQVLTASDGSEIRGLIGAAADDHNHDGAYAPAGDYAASNHNHDGTYVKPSDLGTAASSDVGDFAPALTSDQNYVTDAEKSALHGHSNKAALDAVSGTNTGDQSWPLPGTPGTFPPSSHQHSAIGISDSTATGRALITAADAATARGVIGAGTSNLTLGTTAGTAAAGNDARIVAAVPNTRTVNGKALNADISLTASDVGAAASSHTQAASTITDLAETVQDIVGGFIVAGTNVTVTYDDVANTFTINATASGGGETDPEIVRDVIGAALVAGSGIQITVNDAADQITIASMAVLPTRQVNSGTGLSGGGDLTANRTLSVEYGTTAGTSVQGNDSRVVNAVPNTRTVAGKPLSSDITLDAADVGAAPAIHNHDGTYVKPTDLGTAASADVGDFATSAQGALASTAVQPGDLPTVIPLRIIETTALTAITAASADHGKLIQLTATSSVTITLPDDCAVGTQIEYQATAAGLGTFILGAGASWRPAPVPSAIMLDTGSAVTAICVDTATWMLVGRLA